MVPTSSQSSAQALNAAEMDAIIDCILQGKYSVACLLLLEATGRNPLDFIPYRTYNRLQKQRQQAAAFKNTHSVVPLRKPIDDLDYIEVCSEQSTVIKGGFFPYRESAWSSHRYRYLC